MLERKHIEAIADAIDELWVVDTAQNYDLCTAAISAALVAADESPWRSMDSAPRDGTEIMVLVHDECDGQTEPKVNVTKWDGVVWAVPFDCDSWFVPDCLVAWMPMPAAPEVKP